MVRDFNSNWHQILVWPLSIDNAFNIINISIQQAEKTNK